MADVAASSLQSLKRRQARKVAFFLLAVAAGTTGLFHFLRGDLVAYRRGENALARAALRKVLG